MAWYAIKIGRAGEHAPNLVDITGLSYTLYRCTLIGITGRHYGHVAAAGPLNPEDRVRVAHEFFGRWPLGLVRFHRVSRASNGDAPH